MTDLEEVRMTALASWPRAKELAEKMIHERNQEELPERVTRVRGIIQRFAAQIEAQGESPDQLMLQQETDLMRAGVYTNPLFTRTLG